MVLNFEYHEGSQAEMPSETDTFSSPTVAYVRRNIERIEKEDPQSGETVMLWGYEEAAISYADYAVYIAEQAASKAEYVAMMADIDEEEMQDD